MVEPSGGDAPSQPGGSGARYADRYFGSAGRGRPDPETIGIVAGEAPAPLTDETGTDPRTSTPPPWHAHAAARAALVGTLVAGVLGGMYGWDRWRDREVELAARAAVDVTPRITILGSQRGSITLSVRLHNDGPYPVTLIDVRPADPRLVPAADDFDSVNIDPGSSDVAITTFEYDCDAAIAADDGADESDAVVVHVRSVDGTEHDRGLPFDPYVFGFTSFILNECGQQAAQPTFMDTSPEFLDPAPLGEEAVTVGVRLNTYLGPEGPLPNIVEVAARGSAFSASIDLASLADAPEPGEPHITVTWTVADCAAALVADENAMALQITGQMPADDRTTTINPPPSTGLVVELVRLTERTCR